MRFELYPHRDTPADAVTAIWVEVAPENGVLRLTYRVTGRMADLLVPAPAESERADELWKETCFEVFVRGPGNDDAYCEFNFAPSTRWAAYAFDGYRSGMRNYEVAPLYLETSGGDEWFELIVGVAPGAEEPWRIGLSAVIEETNGTKSYWALNHPPGAPDFHHAIAFALDLRSYLNEAQRQELVDSLLAEVSRMADLIKAPTRLLPTSEFSSHYTVSVEWHDENDGDDVSEYYYVLWATEDDEKWCISEAGLAYRDAFLEGMFRTITHAMAMDALGNPKPGEFDRAELFRHQHALLQAANGAWAEAAAVHHAYLLKK